ncbi:MAG: ammonia-forming cytochrome c nitrite reductase subunit c552 [Veillonella sp.]|nr:ammonia-forming cytochrome c nitrite reductase subunit c552 [Veillonella sp.]
MQKVFIGGATIMAVCFSFVTYRLCAQPADSVKLTPIAKEDSYHNDSFKDAYPLEYNSYEEKNKDMSKTPTGYGGSVLYQHWDDEPANKPNFAGYSFSKDYQEDRGHVYALEDIDNTARINDKSTGYCITCKTPYLEKLYEEYGWKYAYMPFKDIRAEVPNDSHIGCANCHDPQTMELRIINPAFTEALERRGIDVSKASHNDMRGYVCGQCHAEYYLAPDGAGVVFPYDNGYTAKDMYEYYQTQPHGFTEDWTHPDSKVKVLKAQHPDWPIWETSVHADNGVTCIDCHMPYMTNNGQKYTSHWMTSPMKHQEESCSKCHDTDSEVLLNRVKKIEDNVFNVQYKAGNDVAEAHATIAKAMAAGATDEELAEARELTRRAQWYWDYCSASNGMGFHNPDQVMTTLGDAIDDAHKAIESAQRAAAAHGANI